ncbi:MAG: hypothetical protein OQJ81_06090, partial [Melioribacteraceae bacterium]|nr:hypothetical protein [Melioribacteraceae bacterium]
MKKYCYIIISLILILNSGQLYCQFDLKIERRLKQKSNSHRVLPNNLFKSSIGKDELISIGNKLNYFTTLNRSIKNKSKHFTKLDKEPTGKLVKIDNTLIKNKINKGRSNKSFVRSNFKLTENLLNGSGLQSVKKDKMEDGEEWIAVMDYLEENRSLFLTRPIIND